MSCSVHSARPSGGLEHAILVICATISPVIFGSTGGVSLALRSSEPNGPTSQTRFRNRSNVGIDNPERMLTSLSVIAGAPLLQSIARRAFARCTRTAAALRLPAIFCNCPLSSLSNLM